MTALATMLVPIAAGWLATAPCLPRGARGALLALGLVPVVGMAIVSLGYFAWLHLRLVVDVPLWATELPLLAALAAMRWRLRAGVTVAPLSTRPAAPGERWLTLAAAAALFATAAFAVLGFADGAATTPHGESDAYMIWNLRARFLLTAGLDRVATFEVGGGDYPLLLPGAVARGWELGGFGTAVPILTAAIYTFATPVILAATLLLLRGALVAALSAIVVFGAANYLLQGPSQMADVPMACHALATVALLAMVPRVEPVQRRRLLVLAGFTAGSAAWTKNEGVVFALCVLGSAVAFELLRAGRRAAGSRAAALLCGALPGLVAVAVLKLVWAPPQTALDGFGGADAIARLTDPSRHAQVFAAFGSELTRYGPYGWALVLALAVLLGVHVPRGERLGWLAAVVGLLAHGAAVTAVLLLYPHDLAYQLLGINRLILHVWPAWLLVAFLAIRGLGPPVARG